MIKLKSYLTKITCLECGAELEFHPGLDRCPACDGLWLNAEYDYQAAAERWKGGLQGRPNSLWRYFELLPIMEADKVVTMGEGQTPLIRAVKIQERLGHPAIFIKDERQSPTSSLKDRQAAVGTSYMVEAGIKECVLASTGNAAAGYSAYCARADIKLWVFLTSMVPAAKMREAALYGAEVIKVTGTYDQAKKVAADFAARRSIHLDKGAKGIPGKESMKTLAFEIAEELAFQLGGPAWQAPDWYIQAVSGGIGPIGAHKGFEELYKMGLIDRVPKIGVVQIAGCAPMVRAFEAGRPQARPVIPETRITVLSTGDPGLGYELLYRANQAYGGHMLDVVDEEAFEAMRLLAKTEGISVEPATSVAFAGLDKLVRQGIIKPHETVVINCSGHTFPVEKHIMDEEQVLDVRLEVGIPIDGLGAALQRLDEQVTKIVVIDDNPMDSRLIRRLLQARKPYRVIEVNNALEGLRTIREQLPDLVVSDLNMPDMDGFNLLEELKRDPTTANIPVIVVSAKDLTPDDRHRLAEQAQSIWLKGAFSTQDLVEHVVGTLSDLPEEEPSAGARRSRRVSTEEIDTSTIKPSIAAKKEAEVAQKKVVLVEDSPADARLMSRILQSSRPLEVTVVETGQAAIQTIRAEEPHLIILDLMIPDKSGFQILSELRQDDKLDAIPVIVVTAKDLSEAEKQLLVANNVTSMWQKGKLDRKKLLAHVEAHLD